MGFQGKGGSYLPINMWYHYYINSQSLSSGPKGQSNLPTVFPFPSNHRSIASIAAARTKEKVTGSDHAPLALHLLHNLRRQGALVRETHFRRKGAVWHPFRRGPRCGFFHHAVHLFERKALGFRDQEVRVDEAGGAERAPDEEDFGAQVALVRIDHVGRDDCDDL